MKKLIMFGMIFLFIMFVTSELNITLHKTHDRNTNLFILSDSLKTVIEENTFDSEIAVVNYSLELTKELLNFSEKNEINRGKANCIGYAEVCSEICNYGLKINNLEGYAKPVVGILKYRGINLNNHLKSIIPNRKYKGFVKDHDFVELVLSENNSIFFDPCLYDLINNKCITFKARQ